MKTFFAVLMLIQVTFSFAASDEALEKSLGYNSRKKEILCLPENYHSDYEIEEEIKLLKYLGQIDEKFCMDLSHDPTGHKKKLYGMVVKSSSTMEISAQSLNSKEVALVYSPTSDHKGFVFEKDNNGYLKTSAVVLGSIVLGNIISDAAYNG